MHLIPLQQRVRSPQFLPPIYVDWHDSFYEQNHHHPLFVTIDWNTRLYAHLHLAVIKLPLVQHWLQHSQPYCHGGVAKIGDLLNSSSGNEIMTFNTDSYGILLLPKILSYEFKQNPTNSTYPSQPKWSFPHKQLLATTVSPCTVVALSQHSRTPVSTTCFQNASVTCEPVRDAHTRIQGGRHHQAAFCTFN